MCELTADTEYDAWYNQFITLLNWQMKNEKANSQIRAEQRKRYQHQVESGKHANSEKNVLKS